MEKKTTFFVLTHMLNENEDSDIDQFLKDTLEKKQDLVKKLKALKGDYKKKYFDFDDLFHNDIIKIDYDFVKSLNLFDFISAKCFTSNSVLGNTFLDFLSDYEIGFFVCTKSYRSKDHIYIVLKMSDSYSEITAMESLIKIKL
jgi:hypothetical protein